MKHFLLVCLSIGLLSLANTPLFGQEAQPPSPVVSVKLSKDCELVIGDRKAAMKVLAKQDDFMQVLSPFDLQVRLNQEKDVTKADLVKRIEKALVPIRDESRDKFVEAAKELADRFGQLKVKLPKKIYLVGADGSEDSGTAYTRGEVIVLHEDDYRRTRVNTKKLLAHELFHVVSRFNRELRDKMYGVIGFRKTGPIKLPKSLADLKITNPDAPVIEHVIDIKLDDENTIAVAPMLYAQRTFSPGVTNVFTYLKFDLMEVQESDDGKSATAIENNPPKVTPGHPDYIRQIGRNTGYIIHPEEILADNFSDWMIEMESPPDPWVQKGLIDLMTKSK